MIIELSNGCARSVPLDDGTIGIEILVAATELLGPQQVLLTGEQTLLNFAKLCITIAKEITDSTDNKDPFEGL